MAAPITFLHCDHVPRCTGAVDKVFENYASIQFMASGGLYLAYGARFYDLAGGWAWAAWPGPHTVFHKAADQPHWDHRYLAFRGPRVAEWQASGLLPQAPLPIANGARMAHDFDRLIAAARRTDETGRTLALYLVEALLLTLADGGYGAPEPGAFVGAVEAWFYERRFTRPDYGGLAEHLRMGESTLRRRFKSETGQALHDRYLAIKLDTAREMVSDPTLSLKEIAHRLGYTDVYYFSKQFRRFFGTPPGTFRRSIQ